MYLRTIFVLIILDYFVKHIIESCMVSVYSNASLDNFKLMTVRSGNGSVADQFLSNFTVLNQKLYSSLSQSESREYQQLF